MVENYAHQMLQSYVEPAHAFLRSECHLPAHMTPMRCVTSLYGYLSSMAPELVQIGPDRV